MLFENKVFKNKMLKKIISKFIITLFLIQLSNSAFAVPTETMVNNKLPIDKNKFESNLTNNIFANKRVLVKGKAGTDYVPGEIIVKYKNKKNPYSFTELAAGIAVKGIKGLRGKSTQLIKFDKNVDLAKALKALQDNPNVEYAEPNYIRKATFSPNDSMVSTQWALDKMQVPQAWDIVTGSDVTIAIVDSGVDLDHPDLAANLVPGIDEVDPGTPPDDENGHGTHVAGIVAAVTNNGLGIAGIAHGAKIMPVRVLNKDGVGFTDDIVAGIMWAADHGADVINLSLGSIIPSEYEKSAIDYAYKKGAVIVAAAGNDNTKVFYPAAYNHVIGVGATDENDKKSNFSNYGSDLDVVAPGERIFSTVPNSKVDPDLPLNYSLMSGTSMASPQVAGVAALLLNNNPKLNSEEVESLLEKTADDLGTLGFDNYYGYGRINALQALTMDIFPPEGAFTINNEGAYTSSASVVLNLNSTDNSGIVSSMSFSNDGLNWSQWQPYAVTCNWELTIEDGMKTVYAKFQDESGNQSDPISYSIFLDSQQPTSQMSLPVYSTSISKTTTFHVDWSGDDPQPASGISNYDIEYREGESTTWKPWKTGVTENWSDFKGTVGNTYFFRIKAIDNAGNLGPWTTNTYKTVVPYDNNSLIDKRTGFNGTYTNSGSNYYLGSIRYSTKAGEQITYKFTGKKVALITDKAKGNSKAKIYIDGNYKITVDTYSATTKYRQVIYSTEWSTEGTHTIKIVNLGTKGRNRINIDGIAVSK